MFAFQILFPLIGRDDDSAAIGKNVGYDRDSFFEQYVVSLRRCWTIRHFEHDTRAYLFGVLFGYRIFKCGRHNYVAFEFEQFFVGYEFDSRKSLENSVLSLIFLHRIGIKAFIRINPAFRIRQCDNLKTLGDKITREEATHITESLNCNRHFIRTLFRKMRQKRHQGVHASRPRRGCTPFRASFINRLSRRNGRRGLPDNFRILVGNYSKNDGVGTDVRSGDVPLRSKDRGEFLHESPCETFNFPRRQCFWVHSDSPLAAAHGDAGDRALECHPKRESAHFVDIRIGMVADAAFVGAAQGRILDAISLKHPKRAVIHLDGNGNGYFAFRMREPYTETFRYRIHREGAAELLLRFLKCVRHYIFRFTVTKPVTGEPSGARHEIEKVVAAVMGCVAAPPESEFWLKPPFGDVSVQFVTPWVFQKMDVRPQSGTDAGTAQISTLGGTVESIEGVIVVVVVVADDFGFFTCWRMTGSGDGGVPTW